MLNAIELEIDEAWVERPDGVRINAEVTLDGEPKINVGEFVQLHDLVAIPWSQGDRSGVAFRAARMIKLDVAAIAGG